ncbi:MAG: hypothetical protein QXW17_01895 [Candidatus Bathyarchaeia archaeon]
MSNRKAEKLFYVKRLSVQIKRGADFVERVFGDFKNFGKSVRMKHA